MLLLHIILQAIQLNEAPLNGSWGRVQNYFMQVLIDILILSWLVKVEVHPLI